MINFNVNSTPAVSFKGPWIINDEAKEEVSKQFKDGGKKIMDGLSAMATGAKSMIKTPIARYRSSAPTITEAESDVRNEYSRLSATNVETVAKLEKDGYKPAINEDGLFTTMNLPYTGTIRNSAGALIEYKDGKPVTMVVNESNGNYINQRLVKYDYPEGSIAALKTETSVINEYSHELGYSKKVPNAIRQEVDVNI